MLNLRSGLVIEFRVWFRNGPVNNCRKELVAGVVRCKCYNYPGLGFGLQSGLRIGLGSGLIIEPDAGFKFGILLRLVHKWPGKPMNAVFFFFFLINFPLYKVPPF